MRRRLPGSPPTGHRRTAARGGGAVEHGVARHVAGRGSGGQLGIL